MITLDKYNQLPKGEIFATIITKPRLTLYTGKCVFVARKCNAYWTLFWISLDEIYQDYNGTDSLAGMEHIASINGRLIRDINVVREMIQCDPAVERLYKTNVADTHYMRTNK